MKRFLIVLLGIGIGFIGTLGIYSSIHRVEAHFHPQQNSVLVATTAAEVKPTTKSLDLEVLNTNVRYDQTLDLLVFEQQVKGLAGNTVPTAKGQLDGAPVLSYVFPTTLQPEDIGFGAKEGIVALAITSHPDFNDTPLAVDNTENGKNINYGMIFHSHWVLLVEDKRVPGGLAVKEFLEGDKSVILPPTNPGLPIYLDSPGFSVVLSGDTLKVLVPAQRVRQKTNFKYDGVTAYLEVNTSDKTRPMLGVYEIYSINSGDLSLPYDVKR